MQTFITETIEDILKTTDTFNDVIFILPSQRAGVYVKQALKERISIGFLPEIITIEQFIERISSLKKADTLQLLFDFYTIYKAQEKEPASFDNFSSWAFTVLQDFNEIDQYLIETNDLFIYLRDIQRLKKWSVKGEFQETELVKDHYSFLEKLNLYYPKLYELLLKKKSGYQGLLYREATKFIDNYLEKNHHLTHFFIGFNALNGAEEYLVQKVLETKNSDIYWDIDQRFLNSSHQAGTFIRKYQSTWKYYQKNKLKIVGNTFDTEKEITIISAPKNITQIKYAGEILDGLPKYNNTAFVLGDESLLPVALTSLPKKVKDINITMGYPLKNVPTAQLINALFQLFLSQKKLQKKEENLFFYKDILRFFSNASFSNYLQSNNNSSNKVSNHIVEKNASFLSKKEIISLINTENKQLKSTLENIFDPVDSPANFIDKILTIIHALKEDVVTIEKEYLFRFHKVFAQLKMLQKEHEYFSELKTLFQFFKQLIASEHMFFQGEPLKGLQLMGMLETRVLDFENVIMTSVNEGTLPGSANASSFIPFDVKIHFGIPTYKEKDAVFSYHFFRLLQRAKHVFILYNTENDSYGNGEKSRFLMQLELMNYHLTYKTVSAKVRTEKKSLMEITKTTDVIEQLNTLAQKGISPSALTNYLYNPIAFYKQKILHLKEVEEIEETIAANTLGSVIHDALDELYTPLIDKVVHTSDISSMLSKTPDLVSKYFKKYFKNGDVSTGKNRLIFEVAIRFIERFLTQEMALIKNNTLKIIATEEHLESTININGLNQPIKLKGIVDRVDELNGITRIIDYKTGLVKVSGLKIGSVENIEDYKYSKSIQVLLYTYLYVSNRNYTFSKPITAGIFSFKNLKSGLLEINFSEKRVGKDSVITEERLSDFMCKIEQLIFKIYNPEDSFKEPKELPF
ncbi:MAG: PD-(D/E)XK nuclease family protein [Flavobacteriaceae bacterium]